MVSLTLSVGGCTAVMGIKERVFSPLPREVSPEGLVPKDNFYRRLEETLDLSFVRDLVRRLYARGGRPSIDPVVFFKLQLVMFFEGLRSERELMRVAADRLSVRWYLGYDLHEPLPDHSNLTRTRERFGLSVFRLFFERIVEDCVEAGLVRGDEILEVGSGPGRLDVILAQRPPGLTVTGVDISDAMVERAARRAEAAGVDGRVRFEVGDVAALPLVDQEFDGVVSTLSLHHWPDPTRGLADVYRILKPGGEARIYDLAHWVWQPAHAKFRLERLAEESPFDGGEVGVVRWPGAVPAFVLLRLRRAREAQS